MCSLLNRKYKILILEYIIIFCNSRKFNCNIDNYLIYSNIKDILRFNGLFLPIKILYHHF